MEVRKNGLIVPDAEPTGGPYPTSLDFEDTASVAWTVTMKGGRVKASAGGPGTVATRTLDVVIDGGGSVLATGVAGDVFIDFPCTITKVTLLADQTGSIVVDIWKAAYAGYPPTVANTITAADIPTISAAQKSQDSTLTGWTTAIAAGDCLRFNINSVASITRIVLALTLQS